MTTFKEYFKQRILNEITSSGYWEEFPYDFMNPFISTMGFKENSKILGMIKGNFAKEFKDLDFFEIGKKVIHIFKSFFEDYYKNSGNLEDAMEKWREILNFSDRYEFFEFDKNTSVVIWSQQMCDRGSTDFDKSIDENKNSIFDFINEDPEDYFGRMMDILKACSLLIVLKITFDIHKEYLKVQKMDGKRRDYDQSLEYLEKLRKKVRNAEKEYQDGLGRIETLIKK